MIDTCPDCHQPLDDHDGPCAAYTARQEDEKLAAEIVEKLSRYVNQGRPAKFIVDAMSREHRTLQQSMTQVMLQWLVHLASLATGFYDLRNQKSVQVAKAILPVLDKENVVFDGRAHLPLI